MRLVSSSIFVVLVSAIAIIAVNNNPNNSPSNIDTKAQLEETTVKSYILQGATSERLNQLVNGVGGNVSREFPIINAISAMLTHSQAEKIREVGGVRIHDDRTVITSAKIVGVKKNQLSKHFKINNYISEQTGADRLHDMNITGAGVTVAVVDSGTNMWGSIGQYLFRDSSNRQRVSVKYDAFKGRKTYYYNDDQNGHGSHVSGLIASSLRDEDGNFNGIAPDVYLLSVKAFDAKGESSYSKVLDALNWIFENRYRYKIRVVNLSLGAEVQSHYWNDPINQAVMRLWDAGVVIVSSAGNNGKDMGITVPGNTPYIITVGAATDSLTPYDMSDDRVASFSAKGPTYEGFVKPEILAYGSQIPSKLDERYLAKLWKLSKTGKNYSEVSGTSQAAAIVTGVVALMISNDQYVSPNDIKCRLMETAIPANNGEMATYSPFVQGAGLVNAYRATMSTSTNCANTGLDIKQDLMGTQHFMGPAKIDNDGEYYIELADGTLFLNGVHWGSSDMNLNGVYWGSSDLTINGMHWNDSAMTLEGVYWGNSSMSLNGVHWGASEMDLQGVYWGNSDMSLKGLYWGESAVDLNGVYWDDQATGLQSHDLDVEPIDPTGDVPIVEDGWQ